MWMPSTVALAGFPALSAVFAVAPRFSPSPVTVLFGGHAPSMPERPSAQAHSTATSPRYQPAAFGLVVDAPLIVGEVLSMLRSLTVALAVLSALSVTLPITDCAAPSPRVVGPLHNATPESASAQSKLTVTSSLYQPFALEARSGAPAMVGLILSMLTSALFVAEFPALSKAVPETIWCAPLDASVEPGGHVATPETVSAHVKSMSTLVLFQPLALGSGSCVWEIVGLDLSSKTVADCVLSTLPAASTLQNSTRVMPSAVIATLEPDCAAAWSIEKKVCSTPERSSVATKWTVTSAVCHPTGASDVVTGATRSMSTAALVPTVVLPARSLTAAVTVSPVPLPVITESDGHAATPESASLHVQWIVTAPLYQPFPLGLVVGVPVIEGDVLSTLIPVSLTLSEFPAASATDPVAVWLAPSPNVCCSAHVSTPESASAHA